MTISRMVVVHCICHIEHEPMLAQGEVIGMINTQTRPLDVVLCAADSLLGDLHKLGVDHRFGHSQSGSAKDYRLSTLEK